MRKSTSLAVQNVSCSGADNASVHTHALGSVHSANQEEIPGERMQPSAKHVPRGPGAAATTPAAQSSLRTEQEHQAHVLLSLCMCVRTRYRTPSHHRHWLKGRLTNFTKTPSPQNSLESFILWGKEKVKRQTTERRELA